MLAKLGEDDVCSVTPYRDQSGRRIMIYRIGNWRPSKIPIDDIFRCALILFEMGAMEPISTVAGGVGIFDLEGLSLNHAWYVTPSVAKKIISLMVVSISHCFFHLFLEYSSGLCKLLMFYITFRHACQFVHPPFT